MNENDAQTHFQMESGKRHSDRMVEDCFVGIALLLTGRHVQVDGKAYPIKLLKAEGKLMFDIMGLPGFDHVEFCIEKTGWGREVTDVEVE